MLITDYHRQMLEMYKDWIAISVIATDEEITRDFQIPKKIFILLTKDPEKRLVDQHGYCGGESVGFIKYLYKKYNFHFYSSLHMHRNHLS